jgi:hypothetical protein
MKRSFASLLLFVFFTVSLWAQAAGAAANSVPVPHLVKFSGTIASTPTGTVGVIFALYKDQTGGAPLWQEVQNVTVDASGHYTALLGARSATGIPVEVFNNGEARWLGVQAESQAEQARVLLVSVPYAIKAADAETLGGLPASAFLRAEALTSAQSTAYVNSSAVNSAAAKISATAAITISTTATTGYLPVFTDGSGDLGNSLISQLGSFVGIGTATPAAALNVSGTNPTLRVDNFSDTVGDSPNFNFHSSRGSSSTPTATMNGDNLGQFAAVGYTGSAFPGSKVKVTFLATENWTPTANGTALTLQTTANGTTARTERLRVDNNGNVGIGTTAPAYPLSVNGTIQSLSGGFRFPDGTTQTTAATGVVGVPVAGVSTSPTGDAVSGSGTNGATGLYGTSDTGLGLNVANSSANIDGDLRLGGLLEVGSENLALAGEPATDCGSTCTASAPSVPYTGMAIRRLRVTDYSAGDVVATAQIDNTDPANPAGVTVQRDGTRDGFVLVTDPTLTAGIPIAFSCQGQSNSGQPYYRSGTFVSSAANSTTTGGYQMLPTGAGAGLLSFHCVFGRLLDGANFTDLTLTRYSTGTAIWVGTIISDTNQ